MIGALVAFYAGTLGTIVLSSVGYAIGGRWGTIIGAITTATVWLGCLWIWEIFEEAAVSAIGGVHMFLVFAVTAATIWTVLRGPRDPIATNPLDEHLVENLLDTKRKLAEHRPGRGGPRHE
jgi:hypothetical protein